jgi:hypothetical protein
MKKVIRLTERDLTKIVKKVLNEENSNNATFKSFNLPITINTTAIGNGLDHDGNIRIDVKEPDGKKGYFFFECGDNNSMYYKRDGFFGDDFRVTSSSIVNLQKRFCNGTSPR